MVSDILESATKTSAATYLCVQGYFVFEDETYYKKKDYILVYYLSDVLFAGVTHFT